MTTIILSNQTQSALTLIGQWFSQGWRLFLTSPFKLFGSLLAIMVIAGLFQLLPAPTGVLASKWVAGMLAAAFWPMLDQLAKTGRLSFIGLSAYTGWKGLPIIGLLLMLPFVFQLGLASLMLGEQGIPLMIFGQIDAVTPVQVAFIFAAAAPITLFFTFAPAFLFFANCTSIQAAKKGMNMVFSAWQPMLILVLINALVLFLAPFTMVLSALLLSPLLVCVNYVAFQTLHDK